MDRRSPAAKPPTWLSKLCVDCRGEIEFLEKVLARVQTYAKFMDGAKLKDGLKTVMELSSLCNKFMTDSWTPKIDATRKLVIVTVLTNAIRVVATLFEPFLPGFSAIIYFFLGIQRTLSDETFIKRLLNIQSGKDLIGLVPEGQPMNQPIPIFTQISDEAIKAHKERFTPPEDPTDATAH